MATVVVRGYKMEGPRKHCAKPKVDDKYLPLFLANSVRAFNQGTEFSTKEFCILLTNVLLV
jgi:hypothetical protein